MEVGCEATCRGNKNGRQAKAAKIRRPEIHYANAVQGGRGEGGGKKTNKQMSAQAGIDVIHSNKKKKTQCNYS